MNRLDVYINTELAGTLTQYPDGRLGFEYARSYVEKCLRLNNCTPLSSTMPVTEEIYKGDVVEVFLSNLLPEELIRQQLAREIKLAEDDVFALLHSIGRDCGGAVSFWPRNEKQSDENKHKYVALDDKDWEAWLNDAQPYPLLNNPEEEIRVSLAGAQIKTVLYFDKDDRPFRTQSGGVSSHIIKPPHRWIQSNLVVNELVCLQLADAIGIVAAKADIWRGCLRVKRYDRFVENADPEQKLQRLHQEDFCQVLQRKPQLKYENTINREDLHQQCFTAIDRLGREGIIQTPATEKLMLLDLIIFNVLIWNTDAHLKNHSILYEHNTQFAQLAPAYDLICTYQLQQTDSTGKRHNLGRNLAISIGGEKNISKINRKNWERFCKECHISMPLFEKRLHNINNKILDKARMVCKQLEAQYGTDEFYQHFLTNLENQVKRAALWLKPKGR